MARIEYKFEVARQLVPGHTVIHKFGRNDDVDTSYEDIWIRGGTFAWPTAADTLSLSSTSANDTSDGSGARTVTVEGLDSNFDALSETISLSGATPVTSSSSFLRVNRAYVDDCGTYATLTAGGNLGDIDIDFSTGSVPCARINFDGIGFGQTEIARYSVPAGHTAYILEAAINVDSNKDALIALLQRQNADDTSAPVKARRVVQTFDGISGFHPGLRFEAPLRFPEKTDIWWAAVGSAVNTAVSIAFDIYLIED